MYHQKQELGTNFQESEKLAINDVINLHLPFFSPDNHVAKPRKGH
jgi:hypothetical protein